MDDVASESLCWHMLRGVLTSSSSAIGHGPCPEGLVHGAAILAGLSDCFPADGMPRFSVAERNVRVGLGKQAKSH